MVGGRRWMIGVRIFWNICRVCERKGSRDCSMICVCVCTIGQVGSVHVGLGCSVCRREYGSGGIG